MENKIKELEEKVLGLESYAQHLHTKIFELEGKVNLKVSKNNLLEEIEIQKKMEEVNHMSQVTVSDKQLVSKVGATEVTVTPDGITSKVNI